MVVDANPEIEARFIARSDLSPATQVPFIPELPDARFGTTVRRLLGDIAEKLPLGETTTLADTGIGETIRDKVASSDADQLA
jgi:hypothetical protein